MGRCTGIIWQNAVDTFTKYQTARTARYNSPLVAFINRSMQALILTFIVVVVFIGDKNYQMKEKGESSVVSKVIGMQRNVAASKKGDILNITQNNSLWENPFGGMTWDPADMVVPPLENGAIFITTKVTLTQKQTQGKCAELPGHGADCEQHSDCELGKSVHLGHGHMTGICNFTTKTCEIFAWCPLEDKTDKSVILIGGDQLTILIKNFVLFPKLKIRRRNIGEQPLDYINSCLHNPITDPLCVAFKLGDMCKFAGSDYNEMSQVGAVLGVSLTWSCNLDYHIRHCIPKYDFRRLDDPDEISFPGWNFRRVGYWHDEEKHARFLIKHTGIRIVFNVYAEARKFHFVKFTMSLGASLGLLGMATMLSDYILFHCTKATADQSEAEDALPDRESESLSSIDQETEYFR